MSRVVAVVALVIAGVLVVGCGGTVIDSTKLEDTIQQNLESSQGKKVKAVECPSDQEIVVNATFACTVEYSDGKRATATLKIRNEDADVSLIDLKSNK
ncbi:MAG TPA: DUF4333 domain-containing protein [Solirubrobacterales bacterium]